MSKLFKVLIFIDLLLFVFVVSSTAFIYSFDATSKQPETLPISEVIPQKSSPTKTFGDLIKEIENARLASASANTVSSPKKTKHLVLTLLGDSMIQTMGEASYLKNLLENSLAEYSVKILNYGLGATNIDKGKERMSEVLSLNPQIVVVESFAYNIGGMSLEEHQKILKEISQILLSKNVKVIILATIAPNSSVYAKGIEEINFSEETRKQAAEKIKQVLESTVNFAKENSLPLADAFDSSLDANGEGKLIYINSSTHLHPSLTGHQLVSQKIAQVISFLIH